MTRDQLRAAVQNMQPPEDAHEIWKHGFLVACQSILAIIDADPYRHTKEPAVTTSAQTSTPFYEGGPHAAAHAAADGWNINLHFLAGDEGRCYVFRVEQAERLIESLQRELPAARLAEGA